MLLIDAWNLYALKLVFLYVVCYPIPHAFSPQSLVHNCHKSMGVSPLSGQSLSGT